MFGARLTGSVWGREATNQIFHRGGFGSERDDDDGGGGVDGRLFAEGIGRGLTVVCGVVCGF